MRRAWWFGALAAFSLASVLWARQGAVHLVDGSQIVGDVDDTDPDKITVVSHGVHESFPRGDVADIQYLDNLDEQFEQRLIALPARDVVGRLALAHWAEDLGRHDLARRATAEALAIDPTNPAAKELLQTIGYNAALARSGPQSMATTHPAARSGAATSPSFISPSQSPETLPGRPYLTAAQVNRIRQLELKPDDEFSVTFDHDVRKRFLDRGEIDSVSFYALSVADQGRRILATGDAALTDDVRIQTDPAAMVEYRQRIQPMVLAGCAAAGCHNSSNEAGGFQLFTGDGSAPAAYTNFYLLQAYRKSPAAGEPVRLMIDRTYPELSLLVQYGLPQALAAPPHPTVKNFHALFPDRDDPRCGDLIRWISVLLKPEGGSYPDIHYPATPPTTQPAARN